MNTVNSRAQPANAPTLNGAEGADSVNAMNARVNPGPASVNAPKQTAAHHRNGHEKVATDMTGPQHSDPRAALRNDLPDRYLTPEDLVTMFSLPSVETVRAWRRKRIGPPGFRVGKHLRFDPTAVRDWVAQQTARDEEEAA